jgi:cyclic beta-1,2-glucan synthetase
MVRVSLESILGLRVEGGATLELAPCVPDDWPRFEIAYRLPGGMTRYDIHATNPQHSGRGVREARVDGEPVPVTAGVARIPIEYDGCTHRVDVVLGAPRSG